MWKLLEGYFSYFNFVSIWILEQRRLVRTYAWPLAMYLKTDVEKKKHKIIPIEDSFK